MTRNKKIITGTLCIGLMASLAIGGTMAFLTDSESVTNHFSVGDLDITLTEPKWDDDGKPGNPDNPDDPGTPGDGQNLVPGDTREKDPTIKAVTNDSYMRVIVEIQDTKGNAITDKERLALILQTVYYADPALSESEKYSLKNLEKYDTVSADFELVTDKSSSDTTPTGVYYYNYIGGENGVLAEGDEAVLFTNIVIPTDWNQEQLAVLGEYQIVISAQAIQTDNFGNAAEAFDALDAEVANGTIQKDYATVAGVKLDGATGEVTN